MKLVQLTGRETYEGKKIICIGGTIPYLRELCEEYKDILNHLVMLLDDNVNVSDFRQFQERKLPIYPLQDVVKFDLSDTLLLIADDYYRECYDRTVSLLDGKSATDTIYFFANRETAYDLSYRERYADTPLENIIVFRSGPHVDAYVDGMDFADNARALFEYALSIRLNDKYELVWIVKEPDKFTAYQKYQNVSFLSFDDSISENALARERYYRALCLARYFFFTDAYGFVRNCRPDQVRVQLWHGCGYKKRLNTIPCGKRYEYMTVTSPLYAKLHADEFGLRDEQMLVTGCAKTDWLFKTDDYMLQQLHIPSAEKYIFWLPTYRFSAQKMHKPVDGELYKETGMPVISHMQEWETINECLEKNNIALVIKLHPFQDSMAVCIKPFSHIVLLKNDDLTQHDIQLNQILGVADALISDYSSAAVDYLVLDRPMAFCVEDVDRYAQTRGYIFKNILDWLPGDWVKDVDDLLSFIDEVAKDRDTSVCKRTRLRGKMHRYCDQNNCRRILQALSILE